MPSGACIGAGNRQWDLGDGTTGSGSSPPASHSYADNGDYTITLTVSDGDGETTTASSAVRVYNAAPDLAPISGPADPVPVGTAVVVSASYQDPGVLDTHSVLIDWGDGTSTSLPRASGSPITESHTFTTAGVYLVRMTLTDNGGDGDRESFEYVVVYDPTAGFVTGGGWINSPTGALPADATLAGRANFGFVSKYQKGASVPAGETHFQFTAGDFSFHSNTYEWLVIAGARGQFKGWGEVNGRGEYGFLLTVTDGQASGGGGSDRFRLKVWERATGDIVYDNQMGDSDLAAAASALGGGSIVIHSK